MSKAKLSTGTKLIIFGVLLVVIDQIIKILVKTNMSLGESFCVIGQWFRISFVENEGMVIYKHGNGIRAHALALKIYNSKGETEFTDDEVIMISQAAENFCTPNFIDAIHEILNPNPESQTEEVLHVK